MKINRFQKAVAVMAGTSLILSGDSALAQGSSTVNPVPPAAVSAPAPQLSYGMLKILQLAQAKVSPDTIIAFINNSGNRYALNAEQIIYLHQQGVSDAILTAMLNTSRTGWSMPAKTAPPPVAYVQPVPNTSVSYSEPYYYDYYQSYYYYYPAYAWYPPLTFSFSWGGVWGRGWLPGGGHGSGPSRGWYGGTPSGGWHGGGHGNATNWRGGGSGRAQSGGWHGSGEGGGGGRGGHR